MKTALENYLGTIDAVSPTPLAEFAQALVAFQRVGNTFMARCALESAELDEAHADEAARLNQLHHLERGKGDEPRLYDKLENATSRTRFLQARWAQVNNLLNELRTGTNDLRDDQRAIRVITTPQTEEPSSGAQAAE